MVDPILHRPILEVGRTYSSEDLSDAFGFKPYYLRTAGGMVAVPRLSALLLMTHGAEASFEYGDYWDGKRLIYTGRGQSGDQRWEGANRDVAENRRELWLFEREQKFQRRFLGNPVCTRHWWGISPDSKGAQRRILRFELSFTGKQPASRALSDGASARLERKPRPFRADRPPVAPALGSAGLTPEEFTKLLEKANASHHRMLVALQAMLEQKGWTDIEEIPAAIDLWARRADRRVLFEVKTLSEGQELSQVRGAFAQLLEYRFFYGDPVDCLCLVTDAPLSERRIRLLNGFGISALYFNGQEFVPYGSILDTLE